MDYSKGLIVTTPPKTNLSVIEKILIKKWNWINKKLILFDKISQKKSEIGYERNNSIYLLGEPYPLIVSISKGKRIEFDFYNNQFHLYKPSELSISDKKVRLKITNWYKEKALELLSLRVSDYASKMRLSPSQIKIRTYKARWGACRKDGVITFNWKIILAKIEIIDYVIIHEITHLAEMNHSKRFWNLVTKYDPSYKIHRNWLKDNSYLLDI